MSSTSELIEAAIVKTEVLFDLAQDSDWDAFSALDTERCELIRDLYLTDISEAEPQVNLLRAQIGRLIEQNQQLVTLCLSQRDSIAGELSKLRQGSKAIQAYSQ